MKDQSKKRTTRVSRRKFVKGATATTGGLVASSYVKPSMRALGIPSALAISTGGEDPPDDPPPVLGDDCSLELSVEASAVEGQISGTVYVTNASGSGGNCRIVSVSVIVEPKGADNNFGGGCGNPEEELLNQSSTGGSNSLGPGEIIPGPNGATTSFTLQIDNAGIQNLSNGNDFKVHVVVEFEPHHVHGVRSIQVCTSVGV